MLPFYLASGKILNINPKAWKSPQRKKKFNTLKKTIVESSVYPLIQLAILDKPVLITRDTRSKKSDYNINPNEKSLAFRIVKIPCGSTLHAKLSLMISAIPRIRPLIRKVR
jgi:hypothetical protein